MGIEGKIISTPGHTDGSISILFNDGKAIIGDVLMGGAFGGKLFPAKPNYHYYATDMTELNRSIEKLLDLNIETFYVGHGGPLAKADVQKWYDKKN